MTMLQDIKSVFWGYLNTHKTLKPIHIGDILEIDRKTFEGGYAIVKKAKLRKEDNSEKLVALKTLKYGLGDNTEDQSRWVKYFAKELRNIAKISHENIVKVEGFYLDDEKKPVIVSAWAGGGTMSDYIKNHHDCNLRNIAAGIAKGLEYIHKNGIIHADLKGANILMTEGGIPMLSDFGQARAIRYTVTAFVTTHHLREKGTMNWIAPEIADYIDGDDIPNEIICTRQSDMWSYGMVIYELITGSVPYAGNRNVPQYIHDARLQKRIARGELPVKPDVLDETKDWLWQELCIPCWEKAPKERLSAKGAIEKFASSAYPVKSTASRHISTGNGEIFWVAIACSVLVLLSISPVARWMEARISS